MRVADDGAENPRIRQHLNKPLHIVLLRLRHPAHHTFDIVLVARQFQQIPQFFRQIFHFQFARRDLFTPVTLHRPYQRTERLKSLLAIVVHLIDGSHESILYIGEKIDSHVVVRQ